MVNRNMRGRDQPHFLDLDAPLCFPTFRVLIVLKNRDFNIGCFLYHKAEIKLTFYNSKSESIALEYLV